MRNRAIVLIIFSLLIMLLTGCWDYEDINNRSITLSVGVDIEDKEVILNGEIAQSISTSNNSTASISDVYYFTSKGANFEEARYDFDNKIPSLDFSGAIISIAFSKEFAKEKGIESYINRISFIPGFRQSALVVISDQNTEELFKEKVLNDISTGHGIQDTIKYLNKDGVTLYTTVQSIRGDLAFEEIGLLLPHVKKIDGTLEYLGLGIIKDKKYIGSIKAEDSRGAIYLTNKKASYINTIPNPKDNNLLALRTKLKKRKINTSIVDGEIHIDVRLDFNVDLLYEYVKGPISEETIKELELIIEEMVKKEVISAIEKSQQVHKCDYFGFGRYFKAQNGKIFKNIDWRAEYPDAIFNVKVNSKITNYHLINTKVKRTKGGIIDVGK